MNNTQETRKALKELTKKSYPQYRIFKSRLGIIDRYFIEKKKHWYSRWQLMYNFDGYPLMFATRNEAIDWLTK